MTVLLFLLLCNKQEPQSPVLPHLSRYSKLFSSCCGLHRPDCHNPPPLTCVSLDTARLPGNRVRHPSASQGPSVLCAGRGAIILGGSVRTPGQQTVRFHSGKQQLVLDPLLSCESEDSRSVRRCETRPCLVRLFSQ